MSSRLGSFMLCLSPCWLEHQPISVDKEGQRPWASFFIAPSTAPTAHTLPHPGLWPGQSCLEGRGPQRGATPGEAIELEQHWGTQKGLMGRWAVVGGSLHPSLGAQWMGTVAQRPWCSEILCWVLRLGLASA